MARTHTMSFERDDETEVTVEYTISPYDPGNTYGPAEGCYPPEGGEVEIVKVADASGAEIQHTDAEEEKWSAYIAENHKFDEGYDDYE